MKLKKAKTTTFYISLFKWGRNIKLKIVKPLILRGVLKGNFGYMKTIAWYSIVNEVIARQDIQLSKTVQKSYLRWHTKTLEWKHPSNHFHKAMLFLISSSLGNTSCTEYVVNDLNFSKSCVGPRRVASTILFLLLLVQVQCGACDVGQLLS
jgi:hypothetical protein